MATTHAGSVLDRRLTVAAAALSVSAGMVHGSVTQEHLAEWWGYGVFFSAAAALQVAYGLLLTSLPSWSIHERGLRHAAWQRSQAVYLLGIVGNLALIALWAVTRTGGIPLFGPGAGEVEAVTRISVVAKLLELAIAACLAVLLVRAHSSAADDRRAADGESVPERALS